MFSGVCIVFRELGRSCVVPASVYVCNGPGRPVSECPPNVLWGCPVFAFRGVSGLVVIL